MKIRVAIIEDKNELRQTVSDWVATAPGFCVVATYEAAEPALLDLPNQMPDVVLTDINLPGMDGIECVRQLKPKLPKTQFIMLTVYGDSQQILAALAAGATGYLLKRTNRDDLLKAIIEVNEGGSPMSAEIARKIVLSFQHQPPTEASVALSPRENEILKLLSKGLLYKEIADLFGNSVYTVNAHIRNIYEKLEVNSRSQAVAKFLGTL